MRVCSGAIRNVAIPNLLRGGTERPSSVLKQTLFLLRAEHAEEDARLRVVVVIVFAQIEFLSISVDSQWRFRIIGLLLPLAMSIRLIADRTAIVPIDAHRAIAMVGMERALGSVHRNLIVVDAQAVALRVAIREQTSLKHSIGREADSRDN